MHVTRRSLLFTLGAIHASHSSRALARVARSLEPASQPATPKSIYVLFEGPWLISHSKGQDGITAMTVDDDHHMCTAGKWNAAQERIDASGILFSGQTWKLNSSNVAQAPSFTKLFETACGSHKLAWIKKATYTLHPTGTERCVTLPMPTRAYVAGFLPETHISNTGDPVLDASPVSPHVATIFEYAAASGAPGLQVQVPGAASQAFVPGDHLIFRMLVSNPTCPDVQHVEAAFNFLSKRIKTKTVAPVKIGCTSTRYQTGSCAPGFKDVELGLEQTTCDGRAKAAVSGPGMPLMQHYANCAGATLLAGE